MPQSPNSQFAASQISKFTPPPPPGVILSTELGSADSDTPPGKVGDLLFALGTRWVQKLESWLSAHPKDRPSAPCPAAEQYTTIETWLEKLNAWYEANFNGRKIAGQRQVRGRGSGRGGAPAGPRGRGGASGIPDEQVTWGTAW